MSANNNVTSPPTYSLFRMQFFSEINNIQDFHVKKNPLIAAEIHFYVSFMKTLKYHNNFLKL